MCFMHDATHCQDSLYATGAQMGCAASSRSNAAVAHCFVLEKDS